MLKRNGDLYSTNDVAFAEMTLLAFCNIVQGDKSIKKLSVHHDGLHTAFYNSRNIRVIYRGGIGLEDKCLTHLVVEYHEFKAAYGLDLVYQVAREISIGFHHCTFY